MPDADLAQVDLSTFMKEVRFYLHIQDCLFFVTKWPWYFNA